MNFTDPDSRIMKNSTNQGVDQHYNVQVAVDQDNLLILASALSNHPNDKQEVIPTLQALPPEVGKPAVAAMDNGYFSPANVKACAQMGIDPYIATGREPHHKDGIPSSKNSLSLQLSRPASRSKWRINSRLRSARPSIACANVLSSRDWDHQRDPGLSPILAERAGGDCG